MEVEPVTGNISSVSVDNVSTLTQRIENGWKPFDDLETALEMERQEDAEAFMKKTREENKVLPPVVPAGAKKVDVTVPHGFYTPVIMRKKNRELKRRAKVLETNLKYKRTELQARVSNPELTGTKSKVSILKGPDTERAKSTNTVEFGGTPTTMTLQSIIGNSFNTVNKPL